MKNLLNKIKKFIYQETEIEIFLYKHGEIVGKKTVKYFNLIEKVFDFDEFRIEGSKLEFSRTPNKGIIIKVHHNCE